MTWQAGFTLLLGIVVFAVLIKPLGIYLYRIFTFQPTSLDRMFRPGERWLFKRLHISTDQSMPAVQYGLALILTNFIWVILAYLFLRIQNILPFRLGGWASRGNRRYFQPIHQRSIVSQSLCCESCHY
ncbi:MAG: potassium-transporting ATPase subunit KdpA [Firmicutes bacterium]|nr:potassium-transporting ATPase subunit KdpA [Bacillota bacterium]